MKRRPDIREYTLNALAKTISCSGKRGRPCFALALLRPCTDRQATPQSFPSHRLRLVVGSPFLSVGLLDRDRLSESFGLGLFVESKLALNHVFDCIQMFAATLTSFKVRTTAMRLRSVWLDCVVRSARALRGNVPSIPALLQLRFGGYFKTFNLSGFHDVSPFLVKTQPEAYNLGCLDPAASTVRLNVPVGVSASIGTAYLAERVGFEPTEPCGSSVFKTVPIDRCGNPPSIQRTLEYSFLAGISL